MSIKKVNELKKLAEEIENKIFYLDMKDHWDKEDFDLMEELQLELDIIIRDIAKKENK